MGRFHVHEAGAVRRQFLTQSTTLTHLLSDIMSKPILYTFPMSVWATVPELAL